MEDNQLIFIISAPRSGSSLLQQIIASHNDVQSMPETWLMLPLVYLLKNDIESQSCYNANHAKINLSQYLEVSNNSKPHFEKRLQQLALETYGDTFNKNHTFLLDKTPRYYHIIKELTEWFPKAKIILLARNPASIFCSIMEYNFSGNINWTSNKDRIHDLYTAHQALSKYKDHKDLLSISYENLVSNTEVTLIQIFEYLKLPYNKDLIKGIYILSDSFRNTNSIDTKSVHQHNIPVDNYLGSWKLAINTYQKKRLLLEYLESLEDSIYKQFGYNLSEIKKEVREIRVKWKPFSLSFKLVSNNFGKGLSVNQRLYRSIINRFKIR